MRINKKFGILFCLMGFVFSVSAEESLDLMSVKDIERTINECTEQVETFRYMVRNNITESQRDSFVDAMYSLEQLVFFRQDAEAIALYERISKLAPFNSPQLLGEW